MDVTGDLNANLSTYRRTDYRLFLSAHLQYLQGLCHLSIQSIENSIEQFLTSLFITTELLSNENFYTQLNFLIEQKRSVAPKALIRFVSLMRSINHGNAYLSTYGTNFKYISPWYWTSTYYPYIPNQAIIYDNNCSCGMYPDCTTQAEFFKDNSTVLGQIKGLKMGCTPSESLRASTLECFYDQSCIDLIKSYKKSSPTLNSSVPLSITSSRFLMNTTVAELMDESFVEQWVSTVNYSSYFDQCLPLLCTYTYNEQFNVLYLVTVLIGLQGGLAIVLQWVCPKIVRIMTYLQRNRKKHLNYVHPSSQIRSTTIQLSTIKVNNSGSNINELPTIPSKFEFVFLCFIL